MIIQVLHCPHCHGTDVVRHGQTRQGKQRYSPPFKPSQVARPEAVPPGHP